MFFQNSIQEIDIDKCLHYRGFRYGGYGNNIYEDYILGLHNGEEIRMLRNRFTQSIISLKTSDFAEALNIHLSKEYPAYSYPWNYSFKPLTSSRYSAQNNPDIISHYSKEGILSSHINREFNWLENAYKIMSTDGYLPEDHTYIQLLQLTNKSSNRYIIVDGNHRMSSLYALGHTTVDAVINRQIINRRYSSFWPRVVFGKYAKEDALKIFDRYFLDNNFSIKLSTNFDRILLDEPLDI